MRRSSRPQRLQHRSSRRSSHTPAAFRPRPPHHLALTPHHLALTPHHLALTPHHLALTPHHLALTPSPSCGKGRQSSPPLPTPLLPPFPSPHPPQPPFSRCPLLHIPPQPPFSRPPILTPPNPPPPSLPFSPSMSHLRDYLPPRPVGRFSSAAYVLDSQFHVLVCSICVGLAISCLEPEVRREGALRIPW
ncbi:unnamed protein product [Closterium sp. Naga37s-1]|nr:unnamed protein product [Closterium sp. Naga37s-1]